MKSLIILLSTFFILNAEDLQVQDSLKKPPNPNKSISLNSKAKFPKSVIFIIADGTGIGQYTLSYYANENFPYRQFQHIGLVATHPDDGLKKVTDSASSGTALSTGKKTYNGAIAVDADGNPTNEPLLPDFKEWCDNNPHIFKIACKLRSLIKNKSIHPSAILLSHENLEDNCPTELDSSKTSLVSSYDASWVSMFNVKLDILGLRDRISFIIDFSNLKFGFSCINN